MQTEELYDLQLLTSQNSHDMIDTKVKNEIWSGYRQDTHL
jgi:hypothetical protein